MLLLLQTLTMKVTYSIQRDDLKKRRYKAGTRSQRGKWPATPDYDLLRPIIQKIMTKPDN